MLIIGIDHGYGNIRTANCVFPTDLMKRDTEPTFTNDLLVWEGKYYTDRVITVFLPLLSRGPSKASARSWMKRTAAWLRWEL